MRRTLRLNREQEIDPQQVALEGTIADLRRISTEIRITNRELKRLIVAKGSSHVEV